LPFDLNGIDAASHSALMSRVELIISLPLRARLRRALENARPRECCGALLGLVENGRVMVRRVVVTHNASGMREGFSIPDAEIARVRAISAIHGETIVAIFHSHPNGPGEPSLADRRALAYSEWPWVIITPDAAGSGVEMHYYDKPNGL
jgi:proteasome lid subunit RPN8/RPN11